MTTGDLIDQTNDSRLSGFKQTVRVWRGRPVVELEIELEPDRTPEGDPWSNYFACRFAWNDPAAALTRTVLQQAQGFRNERFESPYYFEIATTDQRTTILHGGLPFHRKIGMRMVDSILQPEGETQTKFRFVIALDDDYPMRAALDEMVPVHVVQTTSGPPRMGQTGWFFHLPAKNVQIHRIVPNLAAPIEDFEIPGDESLESSDGTTDDGTSPAPAKTEPREVPNGFTLRLIETEGRARTARLQCFRTPKSARMRDFQGRTLSSLVIDGDGVLVNLTAYEIADVQLEY